MNKLAPIVIALSTAISSAACTYTVRYRAPAAPSSATAKADQSCFSACDSKGGDTLACYATCPGVAVTDDASCSDTEVLRGVPCVTRRKIAPGRTAALIGVVVTAAAVVAIGRSVERGFDDADFGFPSGGD